jgi:hypothetical protein
MVLIETELRDLLQIARSDADRLRVRMTKLRLERATTPSPEGGPVDDWSLSLNRITRAYDEAASILVGAVDLASATYLRGH